MKEKIESFRLRCPMMSGVGGYCLDRTRHLEDGRILMSICRSDSKCDRMMNYRRIVLADTELSERDFHCPSCGSVLTLFVGDVDTCECCCCGGIFNVNEMGDV